MRLKNKLAREKLLDTQDDDLEAKQPRRKDSFNDDDGYSPAI